MLSLILKIDDHHTCAKTFCKLLRLFNLPEKDAKETDAIVQAVKKWLEDNSGWLLVYDNADQPEMLKKYKPVNATGHIVITSRAQNFDAVGVRRPVELEEMQPDEAVEFLFTRTARDQGNEREQQAAAELAQELGCLPLGLEQAGAYIKQKKTSIEGYLTSYRRRRIELLNKAKPIAGDYPQSVETTWAMNFNEVEEQSKAAAELMKVSAYLSPDLIPVELLIEGRAELGPEIATALDGVEEDPVKVGELLEPLARYSLIKVDEKSESYSIHRMVQEVIRSRIDDKPGYAKRVLLAVSRVFPSGLYGTWRECERLIEHAKQAMSLVDEYSIEEEDVATLLNGMAGYSYFRGQYKEAEPLLKRALEIRERQLGADHPDVATSLNNLALLYKYQGRYEEAEPLYERALIIFEKQLGADHPDVAASLNNLALLYDNQGRYEEAEPLFKKALVTYENTLGEDHPYMVMTLGNYAGLLSQMGRDEEAAAMWARVEAIKAKEAGSTKLE